MFLSHFFSLLVAFFIGAWLARHLGPEEYGILNYIIAFVGLFGVVANLGIDVILNRELVKYPEQERELMGTGFRLKVIGGFLAFLLVTLAAFLMDFDPSRRLLIIVFSLNFIFHPVNVISIFFQAKVLAKENVRASIFALTISSLLKVAFIFFSWELLWLVVIYCLDSVWLGLGLLAVYRRRGGQIFRWRFKLAMAKQLWKDSWPLMLAGTAAFIYLRIDQVMIGQFLDETAVGLYAAAVKFVEVWYFLPGVICASLFPAIINAKKTDEASYRRRLKNLYGLMVVLAVGIAIPTTILAPWAIPWLFGSEFAPAVPILQIYIWSGLGLFVSLAISQYLISENLTKKLFKLHLSAMTLNVLLNFWLIPRVGIAGAAWTTLASYLLIPVVMVVESWGRKKAVKVESGGD